MVMGTIVFRVDKDGVIAITSYLQYGGAYSTAVFGCVFLFYGGLMAAAMNNPQSYRHRQAAGELLHTRIDLCFDRISIA